MFWSSTAEKPTSVRFKKKKKKKSQSQKYICLKMASGLALEKHWVNKHWMYHIQNQPKNRRGRVAEADSTTPSLF